MYRRSAVTAVDNAIICSLLLSVCLSIEKQMLTTHAHDMSVRYTVPKTPEESRYCRTRRARMSSKSEHANHV
jgi:hypothetical protein